MYKLQDDLVAKVRGALYYTGVSKLCHNSERQM